MALYEHVFLARQDISGQQAEALVEQFKEILAAAGGSVGKVENWGVRTAAYRIKKNRKAHYVLMNIDAPAPAVAEMERQMRLHDDILRYLTIRVEAHDDEPSAMMQKRDDRRGPRDDRPRGPRPPRSDGPAGGGTKDEAKAEAKPEAKPAEKPADDAGEAKAEATKDAEK